jgi:hypothetical protein
MLYQNIQETQLDDLALFPLIKDKQDISTGLEIADF